MDYIDSIFKFINKKYWLFLIFIALISYVQIVFMYVWKDDNALFFKFHHIDEAAGFFGKGLFGEGLYKFLVFPHWLIFKLVGDSIIWPYYLHSLIYYLITTVVVYKLYKELFTPTVGKVAGFLFACGFIASEGFIWLNESIMHSLSIVLVSCTLYVYSKFATTKSAYLYTLSILLFFLALYITQARVHYFIALLILFDLFWVVKKISLRPVVYALLRLSPFIFIFYWIYLRSIDTRTQAILDYIHNILRGNLYVLTSLSGTVGYMIVPDSLQNEIIQFAGLHINRFSRLVLFEGIGILILSLVIFLTVKRIRYKKYITLLFIFLSIIWIVINRFITSAPQINPSIEKTLASFIGGMFMLIVLVYWINASKEQRRNIFFVISWFFMSIIGYITYNPLGIYGSTERYLVHPFVALVGVLGLSFFGKPTKKLFYIVIILGLVNLYYSVIYQHQIITTKSRPAEKFYSQLKEYMPNLRKGDIVYLDVSPKAQFIYDAAFSVGSMPESTAIAWRYKVDRYDFDFVTSFKDLQAILNKNPDKISKVHSFFYNGQDLKDTTSTVIEKLSNKDSTLNEDINLSIDAAQSEQEIPLKRGIISVVPSYLKIKLIATPLFSRREPKNQVSSLYRDEALKMLALAYGDDKNKQMDSATYSVSSEWQDRIMQNLNDKDENSAWQADRILWQNAREYIQIDLHSIQEIDRVVWINGFTNNSPTEYTVDTSLDGIKWKTVKKVNNVVRILDKTPQVVNFDSTNMRFIRIVITKTISDDAPAISELWVVPTKYKDLDIQNAESFLKNPYMVLSDKDTFEKLLKLTHNKGTVTILGQYDNNIGFINSSNSTITIDYDSKPHEYTVLLPAAGIEISKLKFSNIQIPGNINIISIANRSLSLDDLKNQQ